MEIVRYNENQKQEWDRFVGESKNATFLFYRDFMDYHADRFNDHSLLFYEKNTLVALLPANHINNEIHSHQGLSYGGLLMSDGNRAVQVVGILEALIEYYRSEGIKSVVYKAIPHIYHQFPAEEDLYALFKNEAVLQARSISSTIDLSKHLGYTQLRKRQIKKAKNEGVGFIEADSFLDFWNILKHNLAERYNTHPVHNIEEIESLKKNFPKQIRLFCATKDARTIAGCLVFETDTVAHVQYISADEEGKEIGALDFLFDKLINDVFADKKYFDFGISTENGGLYLSEGLISQKEGFGARATVYDTYIIHL